MKTFFASIPLLFAGLALSQASQIAKPSVATRQMETNQIAKTLYSSDLADGSWSRKELPQCSSFPHHAFIRFEKTPQKHSATSFLAIYELGHPPATNPEKPWNAGITLLKLQPERFGKDDLSPSDKALIVAFNRVLEEDQAARRTDDSSISVSNVTAAMCFAEASGNELDPSILENARTSSDAASTGALSGILLPLVSPNGSPRSQYVNFSQNGLITEAGISLQRNIQ